jgi:NAD(P)-dependent dehydrogenase (short-subunit alcohol dehydrogenase family)
MTNQPCMDEVDPDRSLFSLAGRTALVTGTSRGLGLQMARALARAGANLVITSRSLAALEGPRPARSTCSSTTPAATSASRPST